MAEVEKLALDYGRVVVNKMKKLATVKLTNNTVKAKKLKYSVDKMLFNYRNIGLLNIFESVGINKYL